MDLGGRWFFDARASFRGLRGSWQDAALFLLVLQAIESVLSVASLWFIVPLLLPTLPPADPAAVIALNYVTGLGIAVIGSFWLHGWARLFGSRADALQTFRATTYGSAPRFWLGWLPFIGIIFILWSAVNVVIGLGVLEKMRASRALSALVVAALSALALLAAGAITLA